MIDKSKELTASLTLVNNRLMFEGTVEGFSPVTIDYIPPLGDNLGYTSLELLLLSLSSCVSSALLVLFRKQDKVIESFSVQSNGTRRKDHPTAFEEIHLHIQITCSNLSSAEFNKTLSMAENICPVLYMVKGSTVVHIHHQINP